VDYVHVPGESSFSVLSNPHGGVRPFQQKSSCLTQLTLGPNVEQLWSRNVRKSERTKPSNSTVWVRRRYIFHKILVETFSWKAKRDPEAKMLSLQSFLRKGVSLGHVGRNDNLKDLKGGCWNKDEFWAKICPPSTWRPPNDQMRHTPLFCT